MRWLAAVMLVACGTDEAGDDTGQPVGFVEVFDVDCTDPDDDGYVTAPELLDGPVAIASFEACGGGALCLRYGDHDSIDGIPVLNQDLCGTTTRVYVIR
jgi:hypothetical protein